MGEGRDSSEPPLDPPLSETLKSVGLKLRNVF